MLKFNQYSSLELKGLAYEIVYDDATHILWHDVADILNNTIFIDGGIFYLTFGNIRDSLSEIMEHYRFNTKFEMKGILIMFYINHFAKDSFIKGAQKAIFDEIIKIPEDVCEYVYWGLGYDDKLSDKRIKLKVIVGYKG